MFGDPCSEDSKLRYSPPLPGTGPAGGGIPDMWLFLLSFKDMLNCVFNNNKMCIESTSVIEECQLR